MARAYSGLAFAHPRRLRPPFVLRFRDSFGLFQCAKEKTMPEADVTTKKDKEFYTTSRKRAGASFSKARTLTTGA